MCTHESPVLPDYEDRITRTVGKEAARKAVEARQADVALNGHLHVYSGYKVPSIGPTAVVRVDSSQQERHYAVIEPEKNLTRIVNDSGTVLERNLFFKH